MASPTITQPTSPHSELTADDLNRAFRAFQADTGLIEIIFDGRKLGSSVDVDGETIEIDFVHVKERDLHLIHSIDASRFGSSSECTVCQSEAG